MPLYPPIEPSASGMLKVSDLHDIYWEESGSPGGKPIVFVHGGPGGGTDANHRRFFDPAAYRIILFDQRGCGRSTPHAELQENTTWKLIEDMELLRSKLGIDKWHVFGGSWGSTLALAYAISHPDRVSALILRGIFMLRRAELHWFYQEGCSHLFPDAWTGFLAPIPEAERGDLISAYYKRLTSPDDAIRSEAARAWSVWEAATSKLLPDPNLQAQHDDTHFAEAFARIECHYFTNGGFFESETWILENIDRIRHIPGVIIQGRYDVVCPPRSAWDLAQVWPEADFQIVPDAGHSAFEPGIARELVTATDRLKST